MGDRFDEIASLNAELAELENLKAKRMLAVYCGLHIPAVIESDDDIIGLDELSIAARYIPAEHHQLLIRLLEGLERREFEGKPLTRVMVFEPPGCAKALALDTPIATPGGWTTMGELRVGDSLFDECGQVCRVTWKSPVWRDRSVYRVTTDCGDTIIADHDHEWLVRLCGKPARPNRGLRPTRVRQPFKIKETWELARRRAKRPMIRRAAALETPDAALSIDPYLLGVWLGDGNSSGLRVTSSIEDQPWLRGELLRLGYETRDSSVSTMFGVPGVRGKFVALGLVNDPAHNTHGRKHVPAIYMRASKAQRLALLQGLIDTDGTVDKKSGRVTFCNTNRELALSVRELVRSLGAKAGWSDERATLYGKDCGPVHRVGFHMADAARMPRKAALCRDGERTPDTYIDVVEAGRADTQCIEVDSPSHLFLCGRSMTPTHNSTYGSVLFPAWYLGRNPTHCVIQGSYNDQLAGRFGRRARNTFASDVHRDVFGVGLSSDQKAAGSWETALGGEYFTFGMNAGVTGRRADLIVLDDIIRGRKDADSITVRNSTWETYLADVRTRMKPNCAMLYIACMTGDTPVLMATGQEKPLRDIRRGDRVATYDNGMVSVSTVRNWINHGPDRVYEIRMKSGIIVKANARHPFLVVDGGEMKWQRTATLKKGSVILKVTGASTKEFPAVLRGAKNQQKVKACACTTTESKDGKPAFARLLTTLGRYVTTTCATVTGLISPSMKGCWRRRVEHAPSASSCRRCVAKKSICASIIATIAARSVDYFVMLATLPLAMGKLPKDLPLPLSTCEVTRDTVEAVVEIGVEDVFDIQVDRTENFIANGLVSHNTRWHEDDPAGRILPENWAGKSGWVTAKDGEQWYVLSLAAVIEDAEDKKNDILHRKIGEHIWPEWFSLEHFAQERRTQGPRNWYALFQQRPSANDGNILLRSYWRLWPGVKMPLCDFIISVYDTAFEEGEENDFSARTSWGVFWHEEPIDPEAQKKKERPKWWTEKSKGGRFCAIMLECWQERVGFPELRKLAKADYDKRRPDRVLIEKKASGHSLIQELRRSNVPVIAIDADRSKILRAHAAAVPMEQGCVWYPDRDWARAVIKHCADFPNGLHDDDVDTVVHALMFLRRTFHLETRDQMQMDEFDATLDDTRDTSDRGRQRLF